MSTDTPAVYTAPHGSYVRCEYCGTAFEPRIKNGPNADRFCCVRHKDAFHNERRSSGVQDPSPLAAQQAGAGILRQQQTKLRRVLGELARGNSLHRFQAERIGDYTLHSTVCKIQEYGIRVEREWITVPGYGGHQMRVCRYWLNAENAERACALLGWEPCRQDR
jgi:hypothetical protein